MLLEKIAKWLEKRGRVKMIYRDHDASQQPYLKRYYLFRTRRFAVFIHQFFDSDEKIGCHDHPWNNMSFVRRTGYHEVLADGRKIWRQPGFWCFRKAEEFHRVELEPGTEGKVWTVFVRFHRRRKWGFLTESGWKDASLIDPTVDNMRGNRE
jgi:hypothetical protein